MKIPIDPKLPRQIEPTKNYLSDLSWTLGKRVSEIALQLNGLSEGRVASRHAKSAAMPTTGSYQSGDFVHKSTFAEAGSVGSKYVVIGWMRLTDGSAHVDGTDWVPARVLTGN